MVYPMLFKRGVIQCSFTVTYFSFLLKIHREYQKRKIIIQRYNHATKCLYYSWNTILKKNQILCTLYLYKSTNINRCIQHS